MEAGQQAGAVAEVGAAAEGRRGAAPRQHTGEERAPQSGGKECMREIGPGARTRGRMARPDSSPLGAGRVLQLAHSGARGPSSTAAEDAQATQTARQARAFNALVQAFPERVETISPRRGSAASSRGVRWPRSSQGNAAGAASPGTTSSPGPRTRTPSRKVCDAARVSGPEPAAWAGGPERAKDGDGKARAKRELRQEGGTPEQGGGPLPTGTGQGGAAGIGSAHVHHTFDPVSAGAAAARAPAGKAAGAEHGRRRAPGSQPVRRGRHGACGDVGGTERARCGSEYWRRWIASRVLVAAGQGRRRGRKGTAAGGGGAPNNGRRSGSRMFISRLLRGWGGHAQRRPGGGARGWVSECRGQARFGCEPSPLRRHRDRRDGCDGGRLPRVERRGE